jgi:hypothetical protein
MDFTRSWDRSSAGTTTGTCVYRALKRQFDVDDEYITDLKEEILYAHPVVDDAGKGLVWTGDPAHPSRAYDARERERAVSDRARSGDVAAAARPADRTGRSSGHAALGMRSWTRYGKNSSSQAACAIRMARGCAGRARHHPLCHLRRSPHISLPPQRPRWFRLPLDPPSLHPSPRLLPRSTDRQRPSP